MKASQVHFLMLSGIGYVLTGGCDDPKVGILGRLAALRQSQLIYHHSMIPEIKQCEQGTHVYACSCKTH